MIQHDILASLQDIQRRLRRLERLERPLTLISTYEEDAWTPADGSGAGLSFTDVEGRYTRIGRIVIAEATLTFPTTANTSQIIISGLPYAADSLTGGAVGGGGWFMYSEQGAAHVVQVRSSGVRIYTYAQGAVTNADYSTRTIRFGVAYTV